MGCGTTCEDEGVDGTRERRKSPILTAYTMLYAGKNRTEARG